MTDPAARRFAFAVLAVCLLGMAAGRGAASDLVAVLPVTDRILMLHFDDGHIDYSGIHEGQSASKVYKAPLDTTMAVELSKYAIASADDPAYAEARQPTRAGRKSRGMEFKSPSEIVLEHAIYLELPAPMQPGRSYTLKFDGLADNRDAVTLTFDPNAVRSDTVHVNQVGFTPDGVKYAYLSHWMGDLGRLDLDDYAGTAFHVISVDTGETVYSGTIAKRKDYETGKPQTPSSADHQQVTDPEKFSYVGPNSNFTGADVWECDFSDFRTPGSYRIAVERIGCSYPFRIQRDVYRDAFYLTARALYLQRAGIEKHVEPGWVLPRDFHPDTGRNKFLYSREVFPGSHGAKFTPAGEIRTWGWYHDAGDWDTYPGHIQVPYQLLMVYELKPDNFADGELHIPYQNESSNGVPDILDEARWLLAYYRRTKDAAVEAGLGTGGVPGGYSGRDAGAHTGVPSWEDRRDQYVWGEDVGTTLNYAAGAAWLAHHLNHAAGAGGRSAEAAEWIAEARAAWRWATDRIEPADLDKTIGAFKVRQSRMLAACMLYKVTGEAMYHEQFRDDLAADETYGNGKPGVIHVEPWEFAATAYAMIPAGFSGVDASLQAEMKRKVVAAADQEIVDTAAKRGYRLGLHWYMPLVCGMQSTPWVRSAMAAYVFTGEPKYLQAVQTSADYFLGGNPGNMVWVCGLGDNPVKYPFHCDSWYSRDFNSLVYSNDIIPGLVPYGSRKPSRPGPRAWTNDEDLSWSTAYPDMFLWPIGEVRFENRWSIMGSEFTVHQNQVQAAMTYGFLCDRPRGEYQPNSRPTVEITRAEAGDGKVAIEVAVSADTRRVVYYAGWHYLGESTEAPFAFAWDGPAPGRHEITAVAYDDLGLRSNPSDAGTTRVTVE